MTIAGMKVKAIKSRPITFTENRHYLLARFCQLSNLHPNQKLSNAQNPQQFHCFSKTFVVARPLLLDPPTLRALRGKNIVMTRAVGARNPNYFLS
jgi:hypothetical protein